MFTTWVNGGGNLIAFRPRPAAGRPARPTPAAGTLADGYLKVDTTPARRAPGSPTRRSSSTAPPTATRSPARRAVATLYSSATAATTNPAVTAARRRHQRRPGGGVHLRPRRSRRLHPAGQPGLGRPGARRRRRRSGRTTCSSAAPPRPTGSNLNKVAIPQADEQQRLLANLIEVDEPRPEAAAAVLVLPAQPQGRRGRPPATTTRNGGTAGRFNQYASPTARPAARWRTGSACGSPPTSTRTRR